ncbi:hypothetical protein RchiOBHm_Chr6g0271241 [Rosa chinensis]|uniref:Uncharacterized protein n=1 Tax=Rosa chinensis TaxID=74649 RepID=A0A2P6PQY9_ROSCH|nr:hypothetical protein RchiOBHm_Chr6g0271241 [Rosa chinensis]
MLVYYVHSKALSLLFIAFVNCVRNYMVECCIKSLWEIERGVPSINATSYILFHHVKLNQET